MDRNSSASSSSMKLALYSATNWILFVAGMANLAVGTWASINLQVASAATSLTFGLVLLFAATIDRFESLKGLGIEAKTRQLDEKIEEASEALRRLKELTELTCKVLVDHNSRMGRWDAAPDPLEAYTLAQNARSIMQALGSNQESIRLALKPWTRTMLIDLTAALVLPVQRAVQQRMRDTEKERSGIPMLTTDDPRYIQMTAGIKAGDSYIKERFVKLGKFQIDEYPGCLLRLLEDVPLLSEEEIKSHRARAEKFLPSIDELISEMTLSDPGPWIAEIRSGRS